MYINIYIYITPDANWHTWISEEQNPKQQNMTSLQYFCLVICKEPSCYLFTIFVWTLLELMLSYNNAFFPDVFTLRLQKQPVTQFFVEKDYACCVLGSRMHPCIIFYFVAVIFFWHFNIKTTWSCSCVIEKHLQDIASCFKEIRPQLLLLFFRLGLFF